MKIKLIATVLCFFLSACGALQNIPNPSPSVSPSGLVYTRSAQHFGEQAGINPIFGGEEVVENSLIIQNGVVQAYYYNLANQNFNTATLGEFGTSFSGEQTVQPSGIRFPYTLTYGGWIYNFYTDQTTGNVFMEQSRDGVSWQLSNYNRPVLTRDTDPYSVYYYLWNVGVTVDSGGVWYMTVECSNATASQREVGLCYSTAVIDEAGNISFDTTRSYGQVILHGGNPWMTIVGTDLLVIHGWLESATSDWTVTASIMDMTTGVWTTYLNNFQISVPGIHLADPSLVQLPGGGTMMTMSYNQVSTYATFSPLNLGDLVADIKIGL